MSNVAFAALLRLYAEQARKLALLQEYNNPRARARESDCFKHFVGAFGESGIRVSVTRPVNGGGGHCLFYSVLQGIAAARLSPDPTVTREYAALRVIVTTGSSNDGKGFDPADFDALDVDFWTKQGSALARADRFCRWLRDVTASTCLRNLDTLGRQLWADEQKRDSDHIDVGRVAKRDIIRAVSKVNTEGSTYWGTSTTVSALSLALGIQFLVACRRSAEAAVNGIYVVHVPGSTDEWRTAWREDRLTIVLTGTEESHFEYTHITATEGGGAPRVYFTTSTLNVELAQIALEARGRK